MALIWQEVEMSPGVVGEGDKVFEAFKRPPSRQPLPKLNWFQRTIAGRVINDLDRQVIAQDGYINQQEALMEGVKAKIEEYNDILAEKDARINEADETMTKWLSEENEELTKLRRDLKAQQRLNETLKQENAAYRVSLGIRQDATVGSTRSREKPDTDDSEGSQIVDDAPDT